MVKDIDINSTDQGNNLVVNTDKMKVVINKDNYSFSVYDSTGKKLINSDKLTNQSVSFTHNTADNFYGVNGYDAWENSTLRLLKQFNKTIPIKAGMQGYCGGPFVWSTDGYGVLVDTDGGNLSLSKDKINFSKISKKDIECYIIVGTPKEILAGLSNISGKSPMFPKWAMGFTNSEWGIDEDELLSIVNTYRKKNIPIDNYTLDFDWKDWGANNYGDFKWDTVNFPDGPSGKLKKIMDSKGIKLTGILKPRIHTDKIQGEYATKHNFWYPKKEPYIDYFSHQFVNDLNFALPACRNWFFDNLKKSFDTGIIGWWNDEADEGFDNDEFLNMERAMYYGQRNYSKLRVWSLNRNFYLGAQCYAYGLWSGDIDTGFKSMAMQRERMLSASDLGVTKWGMDSGGFKGTPTPENYARWIEFSAFVPEFRVHGERMEQRQPWYYGATAEKAAKNAIQLRYKLIPYIYSYERTAYETGISISRPLLFDYPTDKNVANYVDAWMFGDYLLVSPVVDQGQKIKKIYLPKGSYFIQNMSEAEQNKMIKFEIQKPLGTYTPETKDYIIKIHSDKQNAALNENDVLKKYGSYNELLKSTGEGFTTGKDKYGKVIYVKVNAQEYKQITIN